MGLTKEQLEQLNNNSFPNNNSGYITPDILRTYNDAVIVNTVNQDDYNADSASFNYRIDTISPSGLVTKTEFDTYTASADLSVSELSASYIAFTASYYVTSASFDSRINNFNPTNLVTTASFNAYTASTNQQLQALEAKTGSYITTGSLTSNQTINGNLVVTSINTYATQSTVADRNAQNGPTLLFKAADIDTSYPSIYDIYNLGSSVWSTIRVTGAGLSTPLISNMSASGADMYVTVAAGNGVSGSTYTLSGPLPQSLTFVGNNLIVSGNIVTNQPIQANTITPQSGNTLTLNAVTTSVNSVTANNISSSQVKAGNVNAVSGNFNYIQADSASITYLKVVYETSSVIYNTGSNILGDNANDDVQTLIGRNILTGSLEVTGSTRITGNLTITGSLTASAGKLSGLNYPTADGTFASQVLQTNGAGVLSFGDVKTTFDTVRNGESTTLVAGTPVYVSGSQGANPIVYRADASNPAKMPVTFVISENIASGANGRGITLGEIDGIDLTGYAVGTSIYVAPGGGWTSTRPTDGAIVQFLGIVTKTGPGGKGLVLNPGPASLPNLATGNLWVGDNNSYPTTLATSSFVKPSQTGSFATTGSNKFIGDQTITGSVNVSGSVNIGNFFNDQLGLVLTADKLSSNYYSYASDYANFNFGVFGLGYDNELYIGANQTQGITFSDWDNNLGNYNVWLQTLPNDGSNLSPIFPRGISVSSSAYFTVLTGSLAAYSESVASNIATLVNKTGSFATTGSNTFNGDQIINGALSVSSSATYDINVTGSIQADTSVRVANTSGTSSLNPTQISVGLTGNTAALSRQIISISSGSGTSAKVIGLSANPSVVGGAGTDPALMVPNASGTPTTIFSIAAGSGSYVDGTVSFKTPLQIGSTINVTGSATFTELTGSLGAYSASVASNLNTVSASAYTVSGSYNSMSSSAVSNVTDTYTSEASVKYIVSLTQAEYAAIVSPNANTLYIVI